MGQPPRDGRGRKRERAVSRQTGEHQRQDRRPHASPRDNRQDAGAALTPRTALARRTSHAVP